MPPGWDGGIEYTLWMVVNVGRPLVHVRRRRVLERPRPERRSAVAVHVELVLQPRASGVRWPTHQPAPGEQVGFFVTAGDARAKDVRAVTERSNVVLVPFPSDGGAYYPF